MCEVMYSSDVIIVYLDLNIWVDVPMGRRRDNSAPKCTQSDSLICVSVHTFTVHGPYSTHIPHR